jgi:hypothetical protein
MRYQAHHQGKADSILYRRRARQIALSLPLTLIVPSAGSSPGEDGHRKQLSMLYGVDADLD